ncbi:MAG: D-2-hydroxyacid dehydrogenase [Acidimicrobiia bacterium]|nr:D-2-hydroxyacid dehydrogenase [Acidimicrobiia bacterium]MDH5291990.1 D-2-hydroxyacid dehydrogenase [Acidimicrobiia bacterium]
MSFRMVLLPPYAEPDWPERIAEAVPGAVVELFERPEASVRALAEADAVYGTLPPELFERAPKLRWIAAPLAGLGPEWFHPALVASDVVVTNMRGIYNEHLAGHLMGFVLAFSRRFDVFWPRQQAREWKRGPQMIDLASSTAVIVGVGGSGAEAARLCRAFGMRTIGVDPRTTECEHLDELVANDRLDEVLPRADFVLITAPEAPSTIGMFHRGRFELMKPTAYLCNIARGKLVVTDDLVVALREGRIAGAGLDVVDPEPLPADHPLWTMPGVLLTPHVAIAGAPGWYERRTAIIVENARRFDADQPLINQVDKANWF